MFCTTFLGKNPLLFWGAGGFPGHLSPPCDWQPCPSAWPLQVFSSPWFLMFRLVYVRIFRNTSFPLLNTSTFWFACDILHKGCLLQISLSTSILRRKRWGRNENEGKGQLFPTIMLISYDHTVEWWGSWGIWRSLTELYWNLRPWRSLKLAWMNFWSLTESEMSTC